MRQTEEMNECVEQNIGGEVVIADEPRSCSISFRCVNCFALFSSVDAYQEHFLTEHLGIATSKPNEQVSDAAEASRCKPAAINETQSESRSYCKRCRSRMLSSSEEDDVFDQQATKCMKNDAGPSVNDSQQLTDPVLKSSESPLGAHVSASDIPGTSTGIGETEEKGPQIPSRPVGECQSTAGSNKSSTSGRDGSKVSPPASSALLPNEKCFEIVTDLLKDANTVSKPLKVLILNFVSGQRVNPSPGKGPILTIPLSEKLETAVKDDGSKTSVLRRTYIKLNYDSGQWEKIENLKQLHSTSQALLT